MGCSQYKLGFKTLGQCKSQCSCNKSPKSFSSHPQYKICSKTQASTNYISCRHNSCSGGNCSYNFSNNTYKVLNSGQTFKAGESIASRKPIP